jgi:hypothetical protein
MKNIKFILAILFLAVFFLSLLNFAIYVVLGKQLFLNIYFIMPFTVVAIFIFNSIVGWISKD